MAGAPNFEVGKDLISITLYAGSRNATTGAMTWGSTPFAIATGANGDAGGSADYFRVSDQRVLEMIMPVGQTNAHYEKILMDSTLVIGEIKKRAGSILPTFADNNDYCKAVIVSTSGTYTYHGTIRSFGDGISNYGKNSTEMTTAPFYDGTNPPLNFTPAS